MPKTASGVRRRYPMTIKRCGTGAASRGAHSASALRPVTAPHAAAQTLRARPSLNGSHFTPGRRPSSDTTRFAVSAQQHVDIKARLTYVSRALFAALSLTSESIVSPT